MAKMTLSESCRSAEHYSGNSSCENDREEVRRRRWRRKQHLSDGMMPGQGCQAAHSCDLCRCRSLPLKSSEHES